MQRFFLTCAIGLGLMAALQLYAQLMNPLTQAVELPKRHPRMAPPTQSSSVSNQVAESFLPNESWLKTAAIRWRRSDQTFMYAQTVEAAKRSGLEADQSTQGDTVRMKPFAMIWKNEKRPADPPLTILAESASVRFENQFFDDSQLEENAISLSGADAGRIVRAALEGHVHVTGPDGLVFDGQDFIFQEFPVTSEGAELYSDLAVNFQYGPAQNGKPVRVRGTSASGFRVEFAHDPNSTLGDDMPRVAEMPTSANLRGRVVIDFETQEKGQKTSTRVSSEGPFQYDFVTNEATFREKVLVSRPRGPSHRDSIECNYLALLFGAIEPGHDSEESGILAIRAEEPPEPTPEGLISRIELKSIRALANQTPRSVAREVVKLISTENGLECELDDLQYDAKRSLFTLTDPEQVVVWRNMKGQQQKFEAPKIEIRHTADQQLEQLSGVGAGQFTHRTELHPEGDADLKATWKDRLDLTPNPSENSTELTIRGFATVTQLDQMEFSAQTLTAWMPMLDELDTGVVRLGHRTASSRKKYNPDVVPIQRIEAVGNVTFAVPGLVGRRIDRVNLTIAPGQVVPLNRPMRQAGSESQDNTEDRLLTGEPLIFECARIEGIAVFDTATQKADIRELHGFDGVHVSRAAPDSDGAELPFEQQPLRVTAREFSATNEGGTRQLLTLRGVVDDKGNIREPVVARIGDFSTEGPKIIIDREKNLVTILGQGILRFPVDRDFSGNPLNPPTIADIACLEKITFDGQKATFLQNVKATLLDSTIRAEEMTAVLNGRVDFSADHPETRGLAIQTMECRDKVSVEMYQYDPKKALVEKFVAKLHQFRMNQETGEFQGKGPGKIEDWSRTGTRRMLAASRGTAQSNRPVEADREFPWEYIVIDFKGTLKGSTLDRWGQLNDEVRLLYAPVTNANVIFKHNDLSSDGENVKNAVWIGSEQMTVSMVGGTESGKSLSAVVEALGNAAMEGRNFTASAYSLQYEQAKEMFTLLGKGRDKAALNVQKSPGDPFSKISAQAIRIFPSKGEVSVDGAKTFTTAFGGQ